MEQPKRRLAAVWFADIVGYSTLSTRDEPAALALVNALQTAACEIVPFYEGRVVKFVGDAVLAEFGSTDSAVRAAVSLHDRYVAAAAERTQESLLRIGVHLGEVNATPDGDLYGDGINTAARLQREASPGQVIVSEDVWRQLRQRPEFRFSPLGAVELRGITTRVEIYDVLFGDRIASPPQGSAKVTAAARAPRATWGWIAIAAALIVAVTAFAVPRLRSKAGGSLPPPPVQTAGPAATAAVPQLPVPRHPASTPVASSEPTTAVEPPKPQRIAERLSTPPATRLSAGAPPAVMPPATADADAKAVRALLERLAAAMTTARPREALAALGPGAVALGNRGLQQVRTSFGDGLVMRVGRIEPRRIRGNTAEIRFVLLAKSASRPEMPLAFDAVIVRGGNGLHFADLRREWPQGRRGRTPADR
jgi:class 3 adenylate cyclase